MTSSTDTVNYTFSISNWWYVEVRAPWHTDYTKLYDGETYSNNSRNESKTWEIKYYDKDGKLLNGSVK